MKFIKSGLLGEYLTIFIYRLKFYNILAHRRKVTFGEIDIIAQRANLVAFIEVKTRVTNIDDVIVKIKQQRRIKKAAEVFLEQHPCYAKFDVRFDLSIIKPWKLPTIYYNVF